MEPIIGTIVMCPRCGRGTAHLINDRCPACVVAEKPVSQFDAEILALLPEFLGDAEQRVRMLKVAWETQKSEYKRLLRRCQRAENRYNDLYNKVADCVDGSLHDEED